MTPEGFKDLVDTLEIMREAIIRPEDITDPSHT
jgi:hypothetical protein